MKLSNVQVMGTAIVFAVPGRESLYKVELCEVAAGGDWRMVAVYEATRGAWRPCELSRRDNGPLMASVEAAARSIAGPAYAKWVMLLGEAAGAPDGPARTKQLAEMVMEKFAVSRKQLAERLNMTPTTLRGYVDGSGEGNQSVTLPLALEALANRTKFI